MAICHTVTAIAVFSAIAADGPNAKARAIEVVIGFSIISFPFVLDRPLWFRSRIRSLATIHQKKPAISSLNETGVGSVSSAAATPAIASSFPKARPSRSRNKLIVGFALIFAVVAVGAAFATLLKLSRTYTDPAAQCELGISSYKSGDYASALKWLRQAADQGNAKAQYNLACMLEKGVGIPQDEVEARKWMEQSAKQGYANAQAVLGLAYLKGQFGLLKDESEAVK